MPKIKDLGIKVIPETMRPPEVGGGAGCTDCTIQPFSICGGTHCGFITWHGCGHPWTFCGCTFRAFTFGCGTAISVACGPITRGCGAISPVCAGSSDPTIVQQPGITREQIATLKDSLRQQITAIEEAEKAMGPKTAAEIDAREKQLNDELADLKARRKNL